MKKLLFLFGLLLIFAVTIQLDKGTAPVDQDVGYSVTITDNATFENQNLDLSVNLTPAVVYLGDRVINPSVELSVITLTEGWQGQNLNINKNFNLPVYYNQLKFST